MTDASTPRERVWATPAGVPLCRLDAIADPGARNFVLQVGQAYFHGFVVKKDGQVQGYADRCPHAGFPLAQQLDAYLTRSGELIQCAWHGALFRIEDGACVGGPCGGARLKPWPVTVREGTVETG